MKKNTIKLMFVLAVGAITISSCGVNEIINTNENSLIVSISGANTIEVGDLLQLTAVINDKETGENVDGGVRWTSKSTEICSIDQNGVVTALKVGTARILAESKEDNYGSYDIVQFTIKEKNENPLPIDPVETEKHGKYTLVWKDDFEGDSLNEENWNYQYGNGSGGWGNNESQYYTKENVSVSNGELTITAKKENKGAQQYTSSRIRTSGKISYTYGRIEAKIKLPLGQGLWPAFWMLPEATTPYGSWPYSGEIDIMEAKGRLKFESSAALHYSDAAGNHKYESATNYFDTVGEIDEYNIYAVEWDQDEFRWYCNDNNFLTINTWTTSKGPYPAPFNNDFHILLNLAVGGHFDGYRLPNDDDLPAEMKVDYVKWFQEE